MLILGDTTPASLRPCRLSTIIRRFDESKERQNS